MSKVTDIWLDMDGTLMDFAQGDLGKALKAMRDPDYYRTVVPYDNLVDKLGELTNDYSISIVSGIPDLSIHDQYLGDMSPVEYMEYYTAVKRNKLEVLEKYFGRNFFSCIEFTQASESKGSIVRFRWYGADKNKFSRACLLDDMVSYCTEWRKLGGRALNVTKTNTVSYCLDRIRKGEFK